MALSKNDPRLTQYPACTGDSKRSYQLSEISQNDLDYFLGIHYAPGACLDSSNPLYGACTDAVARFNKSIQLFSDEVQAVVAQCK